MIAADAIREDLKEVEKLIQAQKVIDRPITGKLEIDYYAANMIGDMTQREWQEVLVSINDNKAQPFIFFIEGVRIYFLN